MGFVFLIYTVILCWIIYLILQWTKSVNPAADGTMIDVSRIQDESLEDSGVCDEKETKEEEIEEESDGQKLGSGVEKVPLELEAEKLETEVVGEKEESEVETKLVEVLENEIEKKGKIEKDDDDFLFYEDGVTEDEYDIRTAEILIKANESDVAQESVCGECVTDTSKESENESETDNFRYSVKCRPDVMEKDSEEKKETENELKNEASFDHDFTPNSDRSVVDEIDNSCLGHKSILTEKIESALEEVNHTEPHKTSETRPLKEVQRETIAKENVEEKVLKDMEEAETLQKIKEEMKLLNEACMKEMELLNEDCDKNKGQIKITEHQQEKSKISAENKEQEINIGKNVEELTVIKDVKEEERTEKETKTEESKEETKILEDVKVSETTATTTDVEKHTNKIILKEREAKLRGDDITEIFGKQLQQNEFEKFKGEIEDEETSSKESMENLIFEVIKEETKITPDDAEKEEGNKGEELKEEIENLESIEGTTTRTSKEKDSPEISEPSPEPSSTEEFSEKKENEKQVEDLPFTTKINEGIAVLEKMKEELKILEDEESKILRDLQETETSESAKEETKILKVSKGETSISVENKDEAESEKEKKSKVMEKAKDDERRVTFDSKTEFKDEDNVLLTKQKEIDSLKENLKDTSPKQDLTSEFSMTSRNTQNTESVLNNISFITQEDIQKMYSKDKEMEGGSNPIKKRVFITQERDCIENYNEEIISEVLETEVVHQRKIEYTEIAGEEEVLYRNVMKVGGEEFVEEFQTKNEIFNEKSCSSSVVTNEEVSSDQQTTATTITKIINLSYTTEECSTENIEIRSFAGDKEEFLSLSEDEQGRKLNIEAIKERLSCAKNGDASKSVTEDTVKENASTFEAGSVENTQCSVSTDGVKETKKPVGGVLLFGGEELLSKIKSRKLIADGYEKDEKPELENGEAWRLSKVSRGIDECQVDTVTSKSTSSSITTTSSSSSSSSSKTTTTMVTRMKNQNIQMKEDKRQINAVEISDAINDLSGQPTNSAFSTTTQFSESQSEDGFTMTSHRGSEGEMFSEIFDSASPLIHLNKDRNKGPLRRRRTEKVKEGIDK